MVAQESEQLNHPAPRRSKMTEEKPQQEKTEEKKKIEAKPLPVDKEKTKEIEEKMKKSKPPKKPEEQPTTPQQKEKPSDDNNKAAGDKKQEAKKEKKKETPKITKKEEAVANGENVPISKKHAIYICRFIKNKKIDDAIQELNKVINLKKPIPFKGEIPHRKGPYAGARYPVKACKYFINMLKALKGNSIVNGLEIENTKIYLASATWARRPMRSRGRSAKRTNIILKTKEFNGGKK